MAPSESKFIIFEFSFLRFETHLCLSFSLTNFTSTLHTLKIKKPAVPTKKAPVKKAPAKKAPPARKGSLDASEDDEKAAVARPQQPIAKRDSLDPSRSLDPFAFTPDEGDDATKFHFSVLCKLKDCNIPLQLDIEKDGSIGALKKKITDRTGGKLALNDMILTIGANVLKRNMTARQAGIKNNVQVVLTLKEDLAKHGAYLHDDRDMSQKEVADNLRKVGVEVPVEDGINPEDKVKSQQKKPYRNTTGKAKDRERFTEEEVNALIDGVATYGLGKWSEILTQSFGQSERTGVDLKDKWRNLTLAASRPPGFTFRVSYMNKELLDRVRQVKRSVEEKKEREKAARQAGLNGRGDLGAQAAQQIHGDLDY